MLVLACSRRSDSGERCEVKRARENKIEGGGRGEIGNRTSLHAPLSSVLLYFSSLSFLRSAHHYLNAWNRLSWLVCRPHPILIHLLLRNIQVSICRNKIMLLFCQEPRQYFKSVRYPFDYVTEMNRPLYLVRFVFPIQAM